MSPRFTPRPLPMPHPQPVRVALLAALALLLALAAGASASGSGKVVAKEGQDAILGATVLTRTNGHTLYSLSVEKHGRFVCTGGCLGTWKPLVVAAGMKPKGPVKLGTVRRPDGRTQVTFKGRPLYSFDGDAKPGEANGEGFKDVGTWHAAKVAAASAPPAPEPAPTPYPY
jgi:predicted lipoprotein with Yx(FWY)xxD motif